MATDPRPDGPAARPPAGVRAVVLVGAAIVAAEAVALVVFAVLDLAAVTSGRIALGVGTSVFFCLYAGGQLVAAVGLARLRGWARGPILFTQLIQLGLAWNLRGADLPWLAPVLAVSAVVVLVCVLCPPALRAFGSDEPEPT